MFFLTLSQICQKSTQRQVDIKIKKQQERWWDRLTLQEKKPLFLAPDFDRWLDESDAEMELQAKVVAYIQYNVAHREDGSRLQAAAVC